MLTANGRLLFSALGGWRWVSCSGGSRGSPVAVAVAWMCCDERITDIAFKVLI